MRTFNPKFNPRFVYTTSETHSLLIILTHQAEKALEKYSISFGCSTYIYRPLAHKAISRIEG